MLRVCLRWMLDVLHLCSSMLLSPGENNMQVRDDTCQPTPLTNAKMMSTILIRLVIQRRNLLPFGQSELQWCSRYQTRLLGPWFFWWNCFRSTERSNSLTLRIQWSASVMIGRLSIPCSLPLFWLVQTKISTFSSSFRFWLEKTAMLSVSKNVMKTSRRFCQFGRWCQWRGVIQCHAKRHVLIKVCNGLGRQFTFQPSFKGE